MALEFKKISDVELLESVPDTANAVVEVDGEFKRVPGSNLGGGGIPTAIIHVELDISSEPASLATLAEARDISNDITGTCENMTFEEAFAIMEAKQPLAAKIVYAINGGDITHICENVIYIASGVENGIAVIGFETSVAGSLYWTADGISTEAPGAAE